MKISIHWLYLLIQGGWGIWAFINNHIVFGIWCLFWAIIAIYCIITDKS